VRKDGTSKGSSISKLLGCICEKGEVKHSKWSQVHFHLRNGLLWYKQNLLYVLEGKMRDTILKECHNGPLAGHGGAKHTTTFLRKSYYWPNLKDNAEEYVMTCLTC